MKRRMLSKLLLTLITASLLLSGCGAEETDANVESSQVKEEQESNEQVESSQVAEQQEEEKEIEYVSFTWSVSDKDLYLLMRRQLEAKPSLFEGSVTYSDGTTGSIEADKVELSRNGLDLKLDIYYRDDQTEGYIIQIPEIWEDSADNATEDEIGEWYEGLGGDSSVIDEFNTSGSVTQVNDDEPWSGLYSVKDAPGLTNIDWGLFNGYMYAEQMSFLGDENLEINVLQVLGSDPRINNDWSALNDKFSALYGNDNEGMTKFVQDVITSYDNSNYFTMGFGNYAILYIEPYRSNTDNGAYGVITEGDLADAEGYQKYIDEIDASRDEVVDDSITTEQDAVNQEDWAKPYIEEFNRLRGVYFPDKVYVNLDMVKEDYDYYISEGILSDPDGMYKKALNIE